MFIQHLLNVASLNIVQSPHIKDVFLLHNKGKISETFVVSMLSTRYM